MVVTPETVVRWHRAGFRLYWRLISRVKRRAGRKKLSKDVRHLIFRRWRRTPPGVLLGFTVSFSPARRWLSFLHNHREAIAAMDFFTVPTITFGGLYCFFIIGHDRRRILHFNVTRHPTGAWIVQQLREAFPYERATEFLLLDHDSKYGTEVPVGIRSMDIKAVRTAVGCPWQNGVAERWVGSCRRELLDHVIAISESHLKRLLSSYVEYYHQDRTHDAAKVALELHRDHAILSHRLPLPGGGTTAGFRIHTCRLAADIAAGNESKDSSD